MNKKLQKQIDNIPKIKHSREYRDICYIEGDIKTIISSLQEFIKEFGDNAHLSIDSGYENTSIIIDYSYNRSEEEIEQDKKNLIEEYNKSKQKSAKRRKELKEKEFQLYQKLKEKYE